jgi:hypothetical protein
MRTKNATNLLTGKTPIGVSMQIDDILGLNDLPHDSCQKCGKVFNNKEVKKYGFNKPALCYNCYIRFMLLLQFLR